MAEKIVKDSQCLVKDSQCLVNELVNDCISRQAAIDALDEQIALCNKALGSFDISMKDEYAVKVERASLKAYRETLNVLPSAQPEIIRCKDCKFYTAMNRKTKSGICSLIMHQNFGDDWYCAGAERRADG